MTMTPLELMQKLPEGSVWRPVFARIIFLDDLLATELRAPKNSALRAEAIGERRHAVAKLRMAGFDVSYT